MRFKRKLALAAVGTAAVTGAGLLGTAAAWASPKHDHPSFIGRFHRTSLVASTVPGNGDVNPYGVAVVQRSEGRLRQGSILVSNFNNSKNLQGTGSTIVQISPAGHRTVFAHITKSSLPGKCPGGIGLTTALVIVHGWVIVGDLPSMNGQAATSSPGCLLVLDGNGMVRKIFRGHGINGPWDATAVSLRRTAAVFVSNVLNGTVAAKGAVVHRGTVLRLMISFRRGQLPAIQSVTKVGSGFAERTDPAAFVVGPTGLGLSREGTLYVADTGQNRITRIEDALTRNSTAGTGDVVTTGGALNSPLGLTVAPGGDVLTVNGGNGLIVETTPDGNQIAMRFLDRSGSPPGNGALFGLAIAPHAAGVYYVDDAANTLRLLH
ncbi:MAG TPA: hypothetical protein VF834_25695 [Streptosporangiaceae bacterium]